MLAHFPERTFNPQDPSDSTRVLWSRKPTANAIVFVHGYRGAATSTWTKFESLLPNEPQANGYDLFFYGYECFTSNTIASGRLFCDFINELATKPASLANASLPTSAARPASFRYRKIVLVAHSIGAIVCRRALLMAKRLGYSWMPQTSLILFAPAHSGARISELLKETEGWFKFAVTLSRYHSPLVDEVNYGSRAMKQLLKETKAVLKAGNADYLKAKKVIIAEIERVVDNMVFAEDPVPVALKGATHTSVCKPRTDYQRPLIEVIQVM